jgi:hypothetical protein
MNFSFPIPVIDKVALSTQYGHRHPIAERRVPHGKRKFADNVLDHLKKYLIRHTGREAKIRRHLSSKSSYTRLASHHLENQHFQDTEQDTKQPPKVMPFHPSKQSPEIISQKFDCSDEFLKYGALSSQVAFAYMSSGYSFAKTMETIIFKQNNQ